MGYSRGGGYYSSGGYYDRPSRGYRRGGPPRRYEYDDYEDEVDERDQHEPPPSRGRSRGRRFYRSSYYRRGSGSRGRGGPRRDYPKNVEENGLDHDEDEPLERPPPRGRGSLRGRGRSYRYRSRRPFRGGSKRGIPKKEQNHDGSDDDIIEEEEVISHSKGDHGAHVDGPHDENTNANESSC